MGDVTCWACDHCGATVCADRTHSVETCRDNLKQARDDLNAKARDLRAENERLKGLLSPKPVDERMVRHALDQARERYRQSPTEANGRECERLYLLLPEGQGLASGYVQAEDE